MSSYADAKKLIESIAAECQEDLDCYRVGSQFSKIYMINAIFLTLVFFQMLCLAGGAFRPWFNFFGVLCTPCVFCAHFIIIIITGTYRFSDAGKLCALTTLPSYYETASSEATD